MFRQYSWFQELESSLAKFGKLLIDIINAFKYFRYIMCSGQEIYPKGEVLLLFCVSQQKIYRNMIKTIP
jgi:hypothetical protein